MRRTSISTPVGLVSVDDLVLISHGRAAFERHAYGYVTKVGPVNIEVILTRSGKRMSGIKHHQIISKHGPKDNISRELAAVVWPPKTPKE